MKNLQKLTEEFEEKIILAKKTGGLNWLLLVQNIMLEAVTYERAERGVNNEITLDQIISIDASATGTDWSHKFAPRCAELALS